MNWMTVTWPMVTGICVALALISLRVACGDRQRAPYLFFSLAALAVGAISVFELSLMRTTELGRYETLLRWAVVPIGIMVASVAGFVKTFFRTGRTEVALLAVGLNAAAQVANFFSKIPPVRHAVALHQETTFGGVRFTVPTVVNGYWDWVELFSVITVIVFVAGASIELWRRGGKRRAVVVGGGVVLFFLAARGHAILIEKGHIQLPYLVSFSFVGVLVAMGIELSDDLLHASRLTRELRESERRTDLAAHAAALGFWTWDTVRDEIWANEAARNLFGISPDEPVNLARFIEMVDAADRAEVSSAIESALAEGNEYQCEYRVRLPSGATRWIAARGRVDQDTPLMRGVLMDITSRRESELELQDVRGQLAHAGRVSMLGQLASALAHELNQPLGAILRNAEAAELFLQQDTPDLEEVRAIISDIRKDDQRAGQVIDRLRAMLKRRALEAIPIELGELLGETIALAQADATKRRVMLEVAVAADLPCVKGDRVHLQQVLLNLLLNAMDAIDVDSSGERMVSMVARRNGADHVEVSVRDSGHGISEDKLPHVFEPFFTTKSHGMGMGLAISHTIISAHGGEIGVANNDDGCGVTFRFTLPVAAEKSAS